jgi:N-acetylglucosaminyldiphosphoundecaprenol N-acetyl-beta-D-mannosaminyltransferase
MGVDLVAADPAAATEAIVARAAGGDGGYACFCNVHVIVTARAESSLRNALDGAWAVFADGAPVAWLQRRLGAGGARRVAGPDLMPAVIDRGCPRSIGHFLFGSTPEVLDALETNLAQRFPEARIVGSYAPPPGTELERASIARIRSTRPDVVWCGLGAPRQEIWMARFARELRPALLLGVGAAFDFQAGARSRAPAWMRDGGLEWAHRLVNEPRRLTGRYVTSNTRFLVLATAELVRRQRQ